MFAKTAGRSSRRRQRTSSDDSVKPPKAKRQRSVLRQTGELSAAGINLDHLGPRADPAASAFSNDYDASRAELISGDAHLPIRSAKLGESTKDDVDGTIVLSSTDYYTVDQLPALPDQIRGPQPDPLKCIFTPGHRHALALTESHAIIWPYSGPNSTPPPSETFVIPIPESCRDSNGAVPLGVLLSTASGEHPGLLLVVPSTGKIIYWETVPSASSMGLSRQKSNGIQGSTPGLLAGEEAIEVLNSEPSGIIVTFSSGRIAHITLRDSQGKPAVLVNFFRGTEGASGSGFFGGIKSVLGGSSCKKEATAVRVGTSRQRGQRDVIVATSAGVVEIWDTHWSHGNTLKKKYDVKPDIAEAISHDPVKPAGELEIQVTDVAFCEEQASGEAGPRDSGNSWRLFLVVSSARLVESKTSFVVQLLLSDNESHVLSTHAVDLHNIPAEQRGLQPRMLVSSSESTAFLLIGQSLVLLSLTSADESPTSQLLRDTRQLPLSFQDNIHLRAGRDFEVLGYGLDDRLSEEHPACMLMVRTIGVIRVSVFPRYPAENHAEEGQVTAKHRIEQAIFFGTMARNPLNLAGDNDFGFSATEIEDASLEICQELLRSESRFIPSTAISVDQNLRLRAKALDDLASLLMRKGNPVSRPARWELLWAAEKLAAQKSMWQLGATPRAKSDKSFLRHVIESMNDKFKTRSAPSHGDADSVRQWFLRDSFQMEHVIPWIKNAVKPRRNNSSRQARQLSEEILDASELFLAIMETAFRYREEHSSLFGLGDDFMEDGVLTDGFEGLPEFWTSTAVGYAEAGHLLDWELDSCRAWIQQRPSSTDAPDAQVLTRLAKNSARHLRILGQMHRERTGWLVAQSDSKLADESVSIDQAHVKERKWQLFKLAGIGHLGDALCLAEQFRDMGALVELVIELQDQVKTQPAQDPLAGSSLIENSDADVSHRISQYFERFGESWADAYFSRQISMGHPGALLSLRKYQDSVTRFLRKSPAYAKLCWINDVAGEEDFNAAGDCLENLALDSETELWSHRVEISLAKLSKLASSEQSTSLAHVSSLEDDVRRLDDYSEVGEIQDALLAHIRPILEGAIDRRAEAELALDYFGAHIAQDRPSLHEILGDALFTLVSRKVVGADSLIDLLTLLGPSQSSEYADTEIRGQEFYQALRVLDHSRYAQRDPTYLSTLHRLIWRRCMIKDDWGARGKAAERLSGDAVSNGCDTALSLTLSACLTGSSSNSLQSLYRPLSPAEAVMTEGELDVLLSRFRPEQRVRLAADLKREDDILREYIDVGKLDFWFQELLASVESQPSRGVITSRSRMHSESPVHPPSSESKARLTWV